MYLLLSTGRLERYRADMLRCLAAPIGSHIQFRYSHLLVESTILDKPRSVLGENAIVCSVNLDVLNQPAPLTPIRQVTIVDIIIHGTTVTVDLCVEKPAYARTDDFTKHIADQTSYHPQSSNRTQHAEPESGKFFFSIQEIPSMISFDSSIAVWENVSAQLCATPQYSSQPVFWVIVGLFQNEYSNPKVLRNLQEWPQFIQYHREYRLLVYIFHPTFDKWIERRQLLLLTSNCKIISTNPNDFIIDSPYDLKKWVIEFDSDDILAPKTGWIRITVASLNSELQSLDSLTTPNIDWHLDLPIYFHNQIVRLVFSVLLFGLFLALPSILSILQNTSIDSDVRITIAIVSFLSGQIASLVAVFGLRRL